jgi:integrase
MDRVGRKYTLRITQNHAEEFLLNLAAQDHKQSYKIGFEKALKCLFKWKHHKRGSDLWDIDFSFDSPEPRAPEDTLNQNELMLLRESALDYGDIPTYDNVSPEERDQWNAYLAQRLGKPKSKISPEDWENTRGWKIPSLICTSIDAGLRPREVQRLKISWLDLDVGLLRIPDTDSDKTWDAVLQDQSTSILENWIDERRRYDKYTNSDCCG